MTGAPVGDDDAVTSLRDPASTRAAAGGPRHPPGWRDPRLWIGVAIVAVSVVVGSRLLAAADDSVAVWALPATWPPATR